MGTAERNCTILFSVGNSGKSRPEELREKLESKDAETKVEGLKEVILMTLNGLPLQGLLMHVIKYCFGEEDHQVKKLLHTFWEMVDKKGPDGKLLPQMILVCNHLQQDLTHANEYIRGSTLRLLCKIKEPQILEHVIPQILLNLEHRHSFVRKNAVLTVWKIIEVNPSLIPDAAERLERVLDQEGNDSVQRNAFLALFHVDLASGLTYLNSQLDNVESWDEDLQLAALEIIRKSCRQQTVRFPRGVYLKATHNLLSSPSNVVVFEAANTLLSLTNLQNAVKSSVNALAKILEKESDQNVKLICLNRLIALKGRYNLGNHVMDILRALSTPNNDVREKVLKLIIDLTSTQNIDSVIGHLKRELTNVEGNDTGTSEEDLNYKNLLVETIHQCAVKFPNVGQSVVEVLLDFLSDQGSTAKDVILFVREFVERHENLRPQVIEKLLQNILEIRDADVYRIALWIVSEYCLSEDEIKETLHMIFQEVGDLPLSDYIQYEDPEKEDDVGEEPQYQTKTVIGPDGTYIQETIQVNAGAVPMKEEEISCLRKHLLSGKYFLGVALANALTKLILRLQSTSSDENFINESVAKSMLVITSLLRIGELPKTSIPIDSDSKEQLMLCLRILLDPSELQREVLLKETRNTFTSMLENQVDENEEDAEKKEEEMKIVAQVDSVLSFRQLKGDMGAVLIDDDFELSISKATGNVAKGSGLKDRLERVTQFTGFSDPIYAEACVSVHQFDIVLDILIVNQTKSTLQNVNLELQTSGDLKLVEKPEPCILTAGQTKRLQASIKVSSTEAGVIFGNIVYDTTGASSDQNIVVMESIHMDVRDYIHPAYMSNSKFSDMWAEFEWENKVPVNTDINTAEEYLEHILKITNMKCLTPPSNLSSGSGQFLAANLYAKSIFGEDALINVSIEVVDNLLSGYIRIRSKTQGIALCLGDKINADQRKQDTKATATAI